MRLSDQLAGGQGAAADGVPLSAWEAIASRRNVRAYSGRPIAAADLDQILEAARRTPSSQNSQPWDFVAVTDREQLRQLATVWFGGKHIAGSAATIAIVVAEQDAARPRVQFDVGQAVMSIMLAAAGLRIGSCHSAIGDQDLARELLGYPGDRVCALLVSLGYPAGRPLAPIRAPDRRPFDEVIHRHRW